jgi:hypothetical protein
MKKITPSHAEYTYRKAINGAYNFAHVEVQVQSTLNMSIVIDQTGKRVVDFDNGEVNGKTHPDWLKAVKSGVLKTLGKLKRAYLNQERPARFFTARPKYHGFVVSIVKVVGIETDTTYVALEKAAEAATIQAVQKLQQAKKRPTTRGVAIFELEGIQDSHEYYPVDREELVTKYLGDLQKAPLRHRFTRVGMSTSREE